MTIKVFLVEDLPNLQGLVADLLQTLGDFVVVATATTEAEALLWLTEHPNGWDIAIVDLVLDQGSGMGVVRGCRQTSVRGSVVVLSAYVSAGIHRHCLELGADQAFSRTDLPSFIRYCQTMAEKHAPPVVEALSTSRGKAPALS